MARLNVKPTRMEQYSQSASRQQPGGFRCSRIADDSPAPLCEAVRENVACAKVEAALVGSHADFT